MTEAVQAINSIKVCCSL